MEEKMQSAIKSITLDGCTYHNITITPTLINFFYGKKRCRKIYHCTANKKQHRTYTDSVRI